jgi:uncharacterized protein YndB with AHSA1/START domain
MSRSHQNRIDIAAEPAAVWQSLTEGEELARWFAVSATVEPGVGGRWLVSWDESPVAEYGRITVWQPGERLEIVHAHPDKDGAATSLRTVFELEPLRGGWTRLTVTADGFGDEPSWDAMFEGTRNGWGVFVRNLRHYLGSHRGEPSEVVGVAIPDLTETRDEAFARVFGPKGVLRINDQAFTEGGEIEVAASFGHYRGTIDFSRAPALLGLRLHGIGLVRAEFVGSDTLSVHVMLLGYGDEARERIAAIAAPLASALRSAFGRETPITELIEGPAESPA